MRVVIALGGNALLERGQPPDAELQQRNVDRAVAALAPLAADHELVITHGNGPQVGVLALESAADPALSRPYPLASLGAETQGLIGFWLVQGLGNALPDRPVAALVTRTVVAPDDPAFATPTKFVGPVYSEREAATLAADRGWTVRQDGDSWRRVVASPEPLGVVEAGLVRLLVEHGTIVVCAGGGGVPVRRDERGGLTGAEAVVDKDLTSALLAEVLGADHLLLVTDVPGVELEHGTPRARLLGEATVAELRQLAFPAGSMGPKVEAACRFAERTGNPATIGALTATVELLTGRAGTRVTAAPARRWLVDGSNVMGSRPDGWWNDRPKGMARLVQQVAEWCRTIPDEVTVVFDGAPVAAVSALAGGNLTVEFAPRRGRDAADDRIVELATAATVVVTADRGLLGRLPSEAPHMGPGRFLELLTPRDGAGGR